MLSSKKEQGNSIDPKHLEKLISKSAAGEYMTWAEQVTLTYFTQNIDVAEARLAVMAPEYVTAEGLITMYIKNAFPKPKGRTLEEGEQYDLFIEKVRGTHLPNLFSYLEQTLPHLPKTDIAQWALDISREIEFAEKQGTSFQCWKTFMAKLLSARQIDHLTRDEIASTRRGYLNVLDFYGLLMTEYGVLPGAE